jgi:hypothetical protein
LGALAVQILEPVAVGVNGRIAQQLVELLGTAANGLEFFDRKHARRKRQSGARRDFLAHGHGKRQSRSRVTFASLPVGPGVQKTCETIAARFCAERMRMFELGKSWL